MMPFHWTKPRFGELRKRMISSLVRWGIIFLPMRKALLSDLPCENALAKYLLVNQARGHGSRQYPRTAGGHSWCCSKSMSLSWYHHMIWVDLLVCHTHTQPVVLHCYSRVQHFKHHLKKLVWPSYHLLLHTGLVWILEKDQIIWSSDWWSQWSELPITLH